jgi:hypothetical protein
VEKMIAAEEKTRERFPNRNNWDNSDKRNHQSNEQRGRKRRPDNTVAVADKAKKFSKPRRLSSSTMKRSGACRYGAHRVPHRYYY